MTDFICSFRKAVTVCAMLLFSLAAVSNALAAEKYGPNDEAEVLKAMQPKAEPEAPLPPFPEAKSLIPVDAGPVAKQSYAIDANSLMITPDDTIRYTVVATSSSGARNISYEGINCRRFEFKRHAYGLRNGKWVRARKPKWVPVSSRSQIQLHYTLTQFFFCRGSLVAGTKEDILTRLRNNLPLKED